MTTLYCVDPTTGFTSLGYVITSAGTVIDPLDLATVLKEAQFTGANLSFTSSGIVTTYIPTRRFLKSTTGAPTTGSWSAGDEVQDAAGAEWRCTVAGTPGNWVAATANSSVGLYLQDYGATGDGTTDDTAAINATITAAAAAVTAGASKATVYGDSRHTYKVTPPGTQTVYSPTGGTSSQAMCFRIPSGVTLDFRGATVKLSGGNPAVVFANQSVGSSSSTDHDLGLLNVTVDAQNYASSGISTVTFQGVTRMRHTGIKVINSSYVAYFVYNIHESYFDDITADTVAGTGIQLGTPANPGGGSTSVNAVYDSYLGNLRANHVASLGTFNLQGNGVLVTAQRCDAASFIQRDCAAGIKIYADSQDVAIGRCVTVNNLDGSGNASLNSGTKVQGDSTLGLYPKRINIGQVLSVAQTGIGLFLELCIGTTIGSYIGDSNHLGTNTGPDVWVGGTYDTVNSIHSVNSGGNGVLVRSYATDYKLGNVTVIDPGLTTAAVSVAGGSGRITSLRAVDDRGTPGMTRGLDVTGSSASLVVLDLNSSGHTVADFTTVSAGAIVGNPAPNVVPNYMPSGTYLFAPGGTGASTSNTNGVGTARLAPFQVPKTVTLTRIGAEVTAAGDVGSLVRLGIYADTGSGKPGSLVIDAGTIAGDAIAVAEKTISQVLTPGTYWSVAVVQNVTTTQPTLRTTTGVVAPVGNSTIPSAGSNYFGYSQGSVTGALPSTITTPTTNGNNPAWVFIKTA